MTAGRRSGLGGEQFKKWAVFATYLFASAVLLIGVTVGPPSLVLLILAPVVILAINRFPRTALIGGIPALLVGDRLLAVTFAVRLSLAIVAVWGLGLLTGRWRLLTRFHATLALLAVVLIASLELSTRAPSPSASSDLLTLLCGAGICAAAASVQPSVRAVLAAIGAAGVLASLAILSGAFGGVSHYLGGTGSQEYDRVGALGLNPNYLGAVLAIGAVAMVGLAIEIRRPWIVLGGLPILAAIPATKSRSALLVTAVGLFLVVFARRRFMTRGVTIAGFVLLLVIAPDFLSTAQEAALGTRASADFSESDMVRRGSAELALREGAAHPLFGVGYGNFPATALADKRLGVFINTHNDYLRLFAEAGLPALICLIALFVSAIRSSRRVPFGRPAMAVVATYAFVLLSANTLSSLSVTAGVWVLLGTLVGQGSNRSFQLSGAPVPKKALA